jgi:hypothetical protein
VEKVGVVFKTNVLLLAFSTSLYDSAHFSGNTIFVEFEDDTREMAVDVPDSFVAQVRH